MPRYQTLLALLSVVLLSPSLGAETLYVQSASAKLLAQPRFGAPVLGQLARGAAVEKQADEGRWLQVSSGDELGWLTSFVLAPTPPTERASLLGDKSPTISNNARRRASAVTTAGAARGLTAEDRQRFGTHERGNRLGLERMEALQLSDNEVQAFHREVVKQ